MGVEARGVAHAITRCRGRTDIASGPSANELTADAVIDELRKIAFSNMADYVSQTSKGDPYLDFAARRRGRHPGDVGSRSRRLFHRRESSRAEMRPSRKLGCATRY